MASLVKVGLHGKAFFFEGLINPHAVLGHDVPIVERMGHEGGCPHGAQMIQIIPASPKIVVVPMGSIHALGHFRIADGLIAVAGSIRIATVNKIIETVDILTNVSSRVANQSVASVVMVIRSIGCNWNDGLQSLDPCGSSCQGKRAIVGGAGHAHFAIAPESLHGLCAIHGGVAFGMACEPLDHCLGGQGFVCSPYGGTALRESCSG